MWIVQTQIAPFTSDGSIPWDGREHWFQSDTQLLLVALRPFLSHILLTAAAGRQDLVRAGRQNLVRAGMLLSTSSGRLREGTGTDELSLSPLKGHNRNTAKKQLARSVEAWTNNDCSPHCKTAGCG